MIASALHSEKKIYLKFTKLIAHPNKSNSYYTKFICQHKKQLCSILWNESFSQLHYRKLFLYFPLTYLLVATGRQKYLPYHLELDIPFPLYKARNNV